MNILNFAPENPPNIRGMSSLLVVFFFLSKCLHIIRKRAKAAHRFSGVQLAQSAFIQGTGFESFGLFFRCAVRVQEIVSFYLLNQ